LTAALQKDCDAAVFFIYRKSERAATTDALATP
jgi:hypothetical protein